MPEQTHQSLIGEDAPASFDAYDRTYSEKVNAALAFTGMKVDLFTRVKVDYFVGLIEALRPPAQRAEVIDVGCGVGNAHPRLAGHIARLVGIDVSPACINRAAEQNPKNEYKQYDGRNIPYPNESFDAASAVCVFHHIPIAQRLPLVRDIRRVLRSSGLFAVFEHNPLNPLTRYVVNRCEFDRDAILLRKQEAEILLKEAGFREVQSRFILAVPARGFISAAADRLLARVPLGAQYFTVGRV